MEGKERRRDDGRKGRRRKGGYEKRGKMKEISEGRCD